MAKIEFNLSGKPRYIDKSAYVRVLGITPLGKLISQCHGAMISAGTELEKLIYERCNKINDLTQFIDEGLSRIHPHKVFVASKSQVKKCKLFDSKLEPDFVIFKNDNCFIVEVKDGEAFDTEKSPAIHDNLTIFMHDVSTASAFKFCIRFCSWNAETREQIHIGTKGIFPLDQIWTGREFCEFLNIDYKEICRIRTNDQQANLEYFVDSLLDIPNTRNMIIKRLKNRGYKF